jgi:P-type Ca2+ transporter type 2B
MTGESDELRKDILEVCAQRREEKIKEGISMDHLHLETELPSPVLLSGTNIAGGEGKMVVIVVGPNSCLG